MVEVTVLPPQPDQPRLTASYVIKTLGEHKVAFLAANRYADCKFHNDDYVLREDRVADILLMVACTKGLGWRQVKDFGYKLKKMITSFGDDITLTQCTDMVSKALGYNTGTLANLCRDRNGFIENLWTDGIFINEKMFDHEGKIKGPKRAYLRVYQNRKFNLASSRMLNDLKHSDKPTDRANARQIKRDAAKQQRAMKIEFR